MRINAVENDDKIVWCFLFTTVDDEAVHIPPPPIPFSQKQDEKDLEL